MAVENHIYLSTNRTASFYNYRGVQGVGEDFEGYKEEQAKLGRHAVCHTADFIITADGGKIGELPPDGFQNSLLKQIARAHLETHGAITGATASRRSRR